MQAFLYDINLRLYKILRKNEKAYMNYPKSLIKINHY